MDRMAVGKDIRIACCKLLDVLQPFKRYSRFPLQLRSFPLPQKRPLPDPLPNVAILTPCKNSEKDLAHYFSLLDALDYPKERIHLRVLEGDSTDETAAVATRMVKERRSHYASANLLNLSLGIPAETGRRSRPEHQRNRRSTIAKVRNALMRSALETDAAVFVFIDVDMAEIPPSTLKRALEFDTSILMANCLLQNTSAVFDLNAFVYTRPVSDQMARRFVKDGIYQPPKGYFRAYTDRSDGHEIEPLHSVGGTFLVVKRQVAEAGVVFPEEPYHLHIETEGFALMAADAGFGSFCAAQVVVYHPWET